MHVKRIPKLSLQVATPAELCRHQSDIAAGALHSKEGRGSTRKHLIRRIKT